MNKPSIILLGSKPGSVVILNLMIELGWEIKYVIISEKYEYSWIPGQTLAEEAKKYNIKVLTDQNQLNKDDKVDFVISYMFRFLVKEDVCHLARRAAINFHAGPLPKYGGWAFYNLAILENAEEYGCTCHYMDNSFDTGALLKVNTFKIDAQSETAISLERKTQEEMIRLFNDFCMLVENNEPLPYEEQNPKEMRYLSFQEFNQLKEIPTNADEEMIQRYARAFWYPPYDCAFVKVNNTKVEVIPNIAKNSIAKMLHHDDLESLYKVLHKSSIL